MSAEMIFIFFLALILFGPKKLPEIMRQVGKFMAEFKRASNEFTSQIQSEIEKTGVDTAPIAKSLNESSTASFAQTFLPPEVKSTVEELEGAKDRLMQTARMAFEAQNFTLRPPSAPVVASTTPETAPEATSTESAPAAAPQAAAAESVTVHPAPEAAPAKLDAAAQSS